MKDKLRIPSHDNGMISSIPASVIPQEEGYSRLIFNADFNDVPGVVKVRPALKAVLPEAPGVIKGAGLLMIPPDGDPEYLIAVGDDILRYDSVGDDWEVIYTWDEESDGDEVSFSVLGDRIVVSDGINIPFMWDGTTATDLTDMPLTLIMATHRGRIFANDIEDPLPIKSSDILDPSEWDSFAEGSRAFEANDGSGERYTAYLAMDDYLLLGKHTSIHALTGVSVNSFEVFPVHKQIGIGSHKAAIMVGNVAYFPDINGNIYRLEAGDKPKKISSSIQNYINQVDTDKISTARAIVLNNDQYVITLPKSPSGNMTFVYDTQRGRWRMWDTHIGEVVLSHNYNHSRYYITDLTKTQFYRFDYTSYVDEDGTVITAYLDTIELHMSVPEQEKEFYNLWVGAWVLGEVYSINVYCKVDHQSDWIDLTANYEIEVDGNEGDYFRYRVPINKAGRNIQFRIQNNDKCMALLDSVITYGLKELE